jgi:hypothetical protein
MKLRAGGVLSKERKAKLEEGAESIVDTEQVSSARLSGLSRDLRLPQDQPSIKISIPEEKNIKAYSSYYSLMTKL